MDASLPLGRALAIAGELVAGGVGVHETALATPDVVDLGGRCVIPGITDSHTHFPTWSTALRLIRLEEATSAEDAAERMRPGVGAVKPDRWFRAQGFRETNWPSLPTKEILDAVTGDVPAAVISKDFHGIWLNSAGIAQDRRRPAPLRRPGRRRRARRRRRAERPAARGVGVALQGGPPRVLRRGVPGGAARGAEDRLLPRGHRDPRQGRLDPRDPAALAGARARRTRCPIRVWQSMPHDYARPRRRRSASPPGLGSDRLRVGYLKVVHGRHARLEDGPDDRRDRRRDHDARGARGHRSPRRGRALAGRRARDRRPREPERARRVRGDARRVAAARAAPPHRAHAVPAPGGRRPLRRARPDGVGAVLPRALRRGARPPLLGRPARRRLLVARPARRRDAPDQRLRRPDRGARPVGRDRRGRPAALARGPARDGRGGPRRVDGRARRGRPATSAGAGSSCPATSPISSSSTATRSRSRRRSSPRCRSSRRWSAAAGPTTRRRGNEALRPATGCRSRSTSAREDRIVLPVGSTEQHAYLSLGTDSILAERISVEAAEPLGVLVAPAMPFGIAPGFAAFPGNGDAAAGDARRGADGDARHAARPGLPAVPRRQRPRRQHAGARRRRGRPAHAGTTGGTRPPSARSPPRSTPATPRTRPGSRAFPWTKLAGVELPAGGEADGHRPRGAPRARAGGGARRRSATARTAGRTRSRTRTRCACGRRGRRGACADRVEARGL